MFPALHPTDRSISLKHMIPAVQPKHGALHALNFEPETAISLFFWSDTRRLQVLHMGTLV